METTKKTHLPLFGIKKLFPYLRAYRGMLFLMVLILALVQQIWIFLLSVYTEISYRIRV